jgi:hypothetical protein
VLPSTGFTSRVVLRKVLHRFELRLVLLAMVGLLIAQLGALSHAYSHGAVPAPAAHAGLGGHDPCSDCLAFAPLLSAGTAPAVAPLVLPRTVVAAAPAAARSLNGVSGSLGFRSRAPPGTFPSTD